VNKIILASGKEAKGNGKQASLGKFKNHIL